MSVNEITTAAGWMAGLAILALIAAGWRKPARATADPVRARRPLRANYGEDVVDDSVDLARRTPWWKRVWSIVATSGLSFILGALIATLVGYGVSQLVITLTDMLRQ